MSSISFEGLSGRMDSLCQSMAEYQAPMIDSLAALCRIPSVGGEPAGDAPYGKETAAVLKTFLEIGEKLGFRAVNLQNHAGYLEYGSGEKLVAVLGHLDIVPAGSDWQSDPFEPVVLDDRIIARGTADDKGPVVAALYALKALKDEGFSPNGRIRLIVGLDEENGSRCMDHYVEVDELPAAGFTPDANFPVIYAEKGIAWVELSVEGSQPSDAALRLVSAKAGLRPNVVPGSCTLHLAKPDLSIEIIEIPGTPAHASTPWEGKNAIALGMAEADRRLKAVGCSHPFVDFFRRAISDSWLGDGLGIAGEDESGPLTLNAGVLSLDEHSAHLTLDIRYPVTWTLENVAATIKERAEKLGAGSRVIKATAPLHVPKNSALVTTLMETYQDLTGLAGSPIAIGGGTYARSMPNIVAFGPTFPGDLETAHQTGEYITLKTLLASAAIFRQALRRLAD